MPPRPRPTSPRRLQVHLTLLTPDSRPPLRRWLPLHFKRLAKLAGVTHGQITLAIINDQQMKRLHHQYKHSNTTTDVLTFDLRDPSPHPKPYTLNPTPSLDADIAICLPQARRQARIRRHPARLEVLLYALHGLLHLLRYNDTTPAAAAKMHRKEDQLLVKAGFTPIYSRRVE